MSFLRNIWNKMDVIGTYVLLLPFLLVQLIGPGTMPQIGSNGFEIVICSDGELQSGFIDLDGDFHEGETTHAAPCFWAVSSAVFVQSAPVQIPVIVDVGSQFVPTVLDFVVAGVNAEILPPVRAPPYTI